MAFMGMVFAGVALIIVGIIAVVTLVLLIVATVLICTKHKKAALVLYIIASVPIVAAVALVAWFSYSARFVEYETYDGGTVTIDTRNVDKMKEYIVNDDMDGLDDLMDKHPELIYYLDVNRVSLLEYGRRNCSIEIMQTAIDHGARFDDEIAYRRLIFSCTLQNFFDFDYWVFAYHFDTKPEPRFTAGVTTDEIIETARFVIDHGAAVEWENHGQTFTFADSVENWIDADGEISEKDEELLALAREALNKR